MAWLILGACALAALVLAGNALLGADPKKLARAMRLTGGLLLGMAGLAMSLRGLALVGIPLGLFGLSLFARGLGFSGFGPGLPGGGGPRRTPRGGTASDVRTDSLEMRLDHDSGEVEGRILRGAHAGCRLVDLDLPTLLAVRADWLRTDPDAARLLEGYLDRAHGTGWRDSAQGNPDEPPSPRSGPMTVAEAREILGLGNDASADEVRAAHRRLMKAAHPDHGGSAWYAARLNEARDLLLRI